MLIFGPRLLELLGGPAATCWRRRSAYTQIFSAGRCCPWSMNTMAGVLRGTGNMKLPSLLMLSSATCQDHPGRHAPALASADPRHFGMRGVAARLADAYLISIGVMGSVPVLRAWRRVSSKNPGLRIQWPHVLRYPEGRRGCSCFSPLQSDTHDLHLHTTCWRASAPRSWAGYGMRRAARIPADLGVVRIRIASVPMIGMGGRSGRIARARRIRLDRRPTIAFAAVGTIATFIAIFPDVWVSIFTADAGVARRQPPVLATAAPMYAFIGLASSMYFSSQGGQGGRGRCWRKARGWSSSAPAAGGCRRTIPRRRNSSPWRRLRWCLLRRLSSLSVILTAGGPKGGQGVDISPALSMVD